MINFNSANITVSPPAYSNTFNPSAKDSNNNQINAENKENNDDVNQIKEAAGVQNSDDLSLKEVQELSKLKQRDREVRAHEQAHISAGGQYVRSGARFEYEEGPDGKKYAVGGEVSIDTSKIPGDPEATARKMQVIRRAAMVPASPSGQDRRVAAKATQIENRMRTEILLKRYEENASFETGKNEADPSLFGKVSDQARASDANIRVVV
jgi:hypothetical protein